MFLALLLSACSSAPFEPVNESLLEGRALTLVHVPAVEELYLQIHRNGRRIADVDFAVGKELVSSLAVSGAAVLAAHQFAVATAPAGVNPSIDPFSAALQLAIPLVDMAVTTNRLSAARRAVGEFNERVIDSRGGHALLRRHLEACRDYLVTLASCELRSLDHSVPMIRDEALSQFEGETLLLVTSSAVLTPRFEALEVRVSYGIFEVANGKGSTLYENTAVVQSPVHAGLLSSDTRDEVREATDAWLNERLERIDANPMSRSESSRMRARNDAVRRASRQESSRQRRYDPFDEHDPEGRVWLEDDGDVLMTWLQRCYEEAARLIWHDLREGVVIAGEPAVPPGYAQPMQRLRSFSTPDWIVYRTPQGMLVSVNPASRLVPWQPL